MSVAVCLNCSTLKIHWKENSGHGYKVGNDVFCSKDCSDSAAGSIRRRGSIDLVKRRGHKRRLTDLFTRR